MARLMRFAGNLIAPGGAGQGRLCIVTYHRILPSSDPLQPTEIDLAKFDWQMKLLADCFNVLPLADAIDMVRQQRMPPRAVSISFDDGYRSTLELALPVLKKYNLPATVFTTTAYADGGNMWNDRIIEAVRRLPDGMVDLRLAGLRTYLLDDRNLRPDLFRQLSDDTKYLVPQARQDVIATLEKLAGGAPTPDLMLSRSMIATLAREGIDIGGHTATHPILSTLDDDQAQHEIVANKTLLESLTGQPLRLFAYPNGKPGVDFNQRHVEMVRQAGYSAAFTTAIGSASGGDDRYQIPRSRPWDTTPFLFGLRLLRWLATG